jgi:hypothetical protein
MQNQARSASTDTHKQIFKKKEALFFEMSWMNTEKIMLNEIGQVQKDKYHMNSHIQVEYEKVGLRRKKNVS